MKSTATTTAQYGITIDHAATNVSLRVVPAPKPRTENAPNADGSWSNGSRPRGSKFHCCGGQPPYVRPNVASQW